MQLHANFPLGKGLWIWNIPECEGGDIQRIIAKCRTYDINNVLIKIADRNFLYPSNNAPQLTREIVDTFHNSGIKVFSWSYVVGDDPIREADVVLWAFEQLGVDGHVFDPEIEYQNLANNAAAAETMLKKIRETHPNDFLAYAPFPLIDLHGPFPYTTFGKYCDAVMPQLYWGTMGYSPLGIIQKMYEQWSKWQETWTQQGKADSIKPIIPLGQGYDNPETDYVLTPKDLTDFITAAQGYGAVNFWEFSHLLRPDCWEAVRDGKMKDLTALLSRPNVVSTPDSTTPAQPPIPEPAQPQIEAKPTPPVAEQPAATPAPASQPVTVTTESQVVPVPSTVQVPLDKKVVVSAAPNGDVSVSLHPDHQEEKVLIDYIKQFFTWLFHREGVFKK